MIGIDPGVKGGMAYDLGYGPQVVAWGGIAKMHDELKQYLAVLPLEVTPTACLEHVTSSPIMGKRACFTFGHNFGQWETLLFCLKIRSELVKPQTWQRGIPGLAGAGDMRKRALKAHAARLFPDIKVTAATQDALLILNYAMDKKNG